MRFSLYDHQRDAIEKLRTGSILMGGVGSGKSRTALAYYFIKVGKGQLPIDHDGDILPMEVIKPLYIITTARKRDTLEWEEELKPFKLSLNKEYARKMGFTVADIFVDSWNNIKKYSEVKNAFFIFDEQKVVGSGMWAKTFETIAKNNDWILLTATPGDTWSDYIPVFVANGFYKNKTEFLKRHAVFNRYTRYPKIDDYRDVARLNYYRKKILVPMIFNRDTIQHKENIYCRYDKVSYKDLHKNRWNKDKNEPIQNASEFCYLLRKIINTDISRKVELLELIHKHKKIIVFYNFDYELEILRELSSIITVAEWNGHKHEPIPNTDSWLYLVQYTSGAEGWNCIETNAMIFYSLNYSYKIMTQSAGRIDRMTTPYKDLYYYYFKSRAPIDLAIGKALAQKRNFNERAFASTAA
jgi:hypothetical protein